MQLPECGKWNFHSLKTDKGAIAGDIWDPALTKRGLASRDRALDRLQQQPKSNWSRPNASPLGDNKYVIRFKDETGLPRMYFGHFYDDHEVFVITLTGHEKNSKYQPHNYLSECSKHQIHCSADFNSTTITYAGRCVICNSHEDIVQLTDCSIQPDQPPA